MLDFLIKLYSYEINNIFAKKIRLNSFLRNFVRLIANIILPFYFNFTFRSKKYSLEPLKKNRKIIVSLTSFPDRIDKVWLVIETIMRQSIKPDKIIIWLSSEQFESLEKLPQKLILQQQKGLDINFVPDNLMSHKKYYYTFQMYPNDTVITVDDDVFYDSKSLERLIKLNEEFPSSVCIQRGWKIMKALDKNDILPYKEWKFLTGFSGPEFDIFQTGIGGVLYPPMCLNSTVLNKDLFMKYCPFADDIWLYLMGNVNNTKVVKTSSNYSMIPIYNNKEFSLSAINYDKELNDRQFNETKAMLENAGFKLNL